MLLEVKPPAPPKEDKETPVYLFLKKYSDGYVVLHAEKDEERASLLAVSPSGRVVLKREIPEDFGFVLTRCGQISTI